MKHNWELVLCAIAIAALLGYGIFAEYVRIRALWSVGTVAGEVAK